MSASVFDRRCHQTLERSPGQCFGLSWQKNIRGVGSGFARTGVQSRKPHTQGLKGFRLRPIRLGHGG
jgi:hypothetical protein